MKSVKNIVVLTLITLIAGFLLGYVYEITSGPIQKANQDALDKALKAVFAEGDSFVEDEAAHLTNSDAILTDAGFSAVSIEDAYKAVDASGNKLGYVFVIITKEGYGGEIKSILGIKNDGAISGLEILSISETPGLGMRADTDEFKAQFKGKNVNQISYSKTGAKEDYEIDALSGATITTRAMVNSVNAGLAYFYAINEDGGATNE